MKASKQALAAAALLALAAGPAAADSRSSAMSVSVQVVAPGSLSGVVVGSGQDSAADPANAASTGNQGTVVPPAGANAADDKTVQPK